MGLFRDVHLCRFLCTQSLALFKIMNSAYQKAKLRWWLKLVTIVLILMTSVRILWTEGMMHTGTLIMVLCLISTALADRSSESQRDPQ
jgi:hypothetical protein